MLEMRIDIYLVQSDACLITAIIVFIERRNPVFSRSKPDKYEISGDYEKQSEADVAVWTEKLDKLVASTPPIIVTNR